MNRLIERAIKCPGTSVTFSSLPCGVDVLGLGRPSLAHSGWVRAALPFLFVFLQACATTPDTRRIMIEDGEYREVLQKNSQHARSYNGFSNVVEIDAVFLNGEVRDAQTKRKATSFQWSDAEIKADRDYNQKIMLSETDFFMSFFTPESKDDNLGKADTVWRIFLDAGGKRYSGTVQKLQETPSEIADIYPEHTRWATPYLVKFLVPNSQIDGATSAVTITGPLGAAEMQWK